MTFIQQNIIRLYFSDPALKEKAICFLKPFADLFKGVWADKHCLHIEINRASRPKKQFRALQTLLRLDGWEFAGPDCYKCLNHMTWLERTRYGQDKAWKCTSGCADMTMALDQSNCIHFHMYRELSNSILSSPELPEFEATTTTEPVPLTIQTNRKEDYDEHVKRVEEWAKPLAGGKSIRQAAKQQDFSEGVTGRLRSNEFPMRQIPRENKSVPEEVLNNADYSGVEMRILAHTLDIEAAKETIEILLKKYPDIKLYQQQIELSRANEKIKWLEQNNEMYQQATRTALKIASSVEKSADNFLRVVAGVNLQDHPVKEQRDVRDAFEALRKALIDIKFLKPE